MSSTSCLCLFQPRSFPVHLNKLQGKGQEAFPKEVSSELRPERKGVSCSELGRRHEKSKGPEVGAQLGVFAGLLGGSCGWSEVLGEGEVGTRRPVRACGGFQGGACFLPPLSEVPGQPWQSLEQGRDMIWEWPIRRTRHRGLPGGGGRSPGQKSYQKDFGWWLLCPVARVLVPIATL